METSAARKFRPTGGKIDYVCNDDVATEIDDVTHPKKKISDNDVSGRQHQGQAIEPTMENESGRHSPDDDEDDEEEDGDDATEDSEEARLLDVAADFIVLVRDGDVDTLREGVESFGPEKASRACTAVETRLGGLTAMTLAAELGNEEIMRLFIDVGADVNGKNATGGWTSLHCAVSQGFPKVGEFALGILVYDWFSI